MNPKTEIIMMATAVTFALIVLAEFWSETGGSRKTGYCDSAIFFVVIVVLAFIENIGSIIYGTK
jgi:hypothetical protein